MTTTTTTTTTNMPACLPACRTTIKDGSIKDGRTDSAPTTSN